MHEFPTVMCTIPRDRSEQQQHVLCVRIARRPRVELNVDEPIRKGGGGGGLETRVRRINRPVT